MTLIAKHYKTHCPQGHEYTEENSYFVPSTGFRQCKACRDEKNKALKKNRVPKNQATHCKNGHEYTEENTYIQPKTGQRACRTCQRISNKKRWERLKGDPDHNVRVRKSRAKWRDENPEYHKYHGLFRDYQITRESYEQMLREQDNKCLICEVELTEEARPQVDHDHECCPGAKKTCGKCVRGIICGLCNQGLGQFKDDEFRLRKAADYLKRYRESH